MVFQRVLFSHSVVFNTKLFRWLTTTSRLYCTTENKIQWPERVFSGIQPTGVLHLGNYLGAIQNWVHLQNKYNDVIFSIVDLHSMTLRYDHKKLSDNVLMMTAALIACGVNPEKSALFLQSQIPEHTQLCWVLGCFCTSARLARLPQYREKSESLHDAALGLYIYPVLQASDILLYKGTKVPVGVDQIQHLQLSRELARKFNSIFGDTFPVPETLVSEGPSRIKNLRVPDKKMSKSFPDSKSRIEITDSAEEIRLKFKKAVTDCTSKVTFDPVGRPGVSNLVQIYAAVTLKTIEEVCEESEHLDTGQFKMVVADAVIEHLRPIREKVNKLICDKIYLKKVLHDGATKVTPIATDTWRTVTEKTGLSFS